MRRFVVGIRCLLVKNPARRRALRDQLLPCHAGSTGFLPPAVSDVERSCCVGAVYVCSAMRQAFFVVRKVLENRDKTNACKFNLFSC